jgi:hypothetical protein
MPHDLWHSHQPMHVYVSYHNMSNAHGNIQGCPSQSSEWVYHM